MPQPAPAPPSAHQPQRRNFLIEAAAVMVGFIATAVPACAGAIFVLNPLIRKSKPGDDTVGDGFRQVGRLNQLRPGGPPVLFPITGGKKDAWTTYPAAALGAVYVRQLEDGKLTALSADCPHLGCKVNFRGGEHNDFKCPCHASSFSIDGARSNDIPPRNMDSLEVVVRNTDEIWVKFEKYRAGRADQVVVT